MAAANKNGGGRQSAGLDRHPRVLEYDQEGTDDGAYMVTLVPGWAFYDAAARLEDDPEGRYACHTRACDNVRDALEQARFATRCACGRCATEGS